MLTDFIYYSRTFWRIARRKLPVYTLLSFASSFLESISFVMFIPILTQMDVSGTDDNIISKYINGFFHLIGIEKKFNNILIVVVCFLLLASVATICQNMLKIYIRAHVAKDYRLKLLGQFAQMDYRQFSNSSTGYFNNLIINETERAMGAFSNYCTFIASTLNISVYVFFALLLSWQITTVGMACTLSTMFMMKGVFRLSRIFDLGISKENASLQEYLIQTIQSFKYLRSTNNFHKLTNKIVSTINSLINFQIKQGLLSWTFRVALQLLPPILVIGMLYYHVSLKGNSIGSVIVLAVMFYRAFNSMNAFQVAWQGLSASSGGLITVEEAYKKISQGVEQNGNIKLSGFKESIKMEQVSFSYGGMEVLHNMSLEINKNSTVAFVGESGAGKSTFVDLVTGVLKPTVGKILIDGRDYTDIDLSSLRDLIGYVTQEIVVFNDSIANNISLWSRENNNIASVELVARHAHCEEFILDTPDQYNTQIGDRGLKLSGGQRQRLAVARELFRKPEILILDEATSALDTESEVSIQQSIDGLKHNKTIIIIAHRLSTVRNCDYIYVLNKGSIVEHGTFNSLYDNEGSRFRNMCNMQNF
jgi:ABC-type multidrug transport system fused ATPase/permease subunit